MIGVRSICVNTHVWSHPPYTSLLLIFLFFFLKKHFDLFQILFSGHVFLVPSSRRSQTVKFHFHFYFRCFIFIFYFLSLQERVCAYADVYVHVHRCVHLCKCGLVFVFLKQPPKTCDKMNYIDLRSVTCRFGLRILEAFSFLSLSLSISLLLTLSFFLFLSPFNFSRFLSLIFLSLPLGLFYSLTLSLSLFLSLFIFLY